MQSKIINKATAVKKYFNIHTVNAYITMYFIYAYILSSSTYKIEKYIHIFNTITMIPFIPIFYFL